MKAEYLLVQSVHQYIEGAYLRAPRSFRIYLLRGDSHVDGFYIPEAEFPAFFFDLASKKIKFIHYTIE